MVIWGGKMNQEDETIPICIKGVELERILKYEEITMYNAHDLYVKYEDCWECKGYNKDCEYFKSQYLLKKSQ